MKIKKLQPGQVVYSVERHGLGNTTLKTSCVYKIKILEIDPDNQWVLASWNGNSPSKFYENAVGKWRENQPVMIAGMSGSRRPATRKEIEAMNQKQNLTTGLPILTTEETEDV